ncbi:MAG TPA: retropepsin-like aspartic protease [Rhizomicrobium sp.]|nr:retropepsin-like aspartic protease [Rhizomicrobium sp.]
MRPRLLLTCLSPILIAVTPALAENCPPLTLLTQVDMRLGVDGRPYVPVEIDGAHKRMLVDTGGFFSMLLPSAVDALRLRVRHTGLELIGISGETTSEATHASFALGELRADSMDFMVAPDRYRLSPDISDAVGILAPNLLLKYDVDFDFAGAKFACSRGIIARARSSTGLRAPSP